MLPSIRRLAGAFLDELLKFQNIFISNKSQIYENVSVQVSDSIAVFAIYNLERMRFVKESMVELRKNGFYVLAIFNVDEPLDSDQPWVVTGIKRRNLGFDIGMYRDGLLEISKSPCLPSEILLINDSVYYSPGSLTAILSILREREKNVMYSLLESSQHRRHLQTFFLYGVFDESNFWKVKKVFENFKNWKHKRAAVTLGEKMLHDLLSEKKIASQGLWTTKELKLLADDACFQCGLELELQDSKINPTSHLVHLLKQYGINIKKY
jgi:hypothetical protein